MKDLFLRRSVRKYTNEKITKEEIEKLIKAGVSAPSAKNEQPWEFIVVNEQEVLDELSNVSEYAHWIKDAPLCIIVLANKNKVSTKLYQQDLAAATENILLEAKHLNLGTCWIGTYPKEPNMNFITKMFNLPSEIEPFSVIVVGHPLETDAFHEVTRNYTIHYNRW